MNMIINWDLHFLQYLYRQYSQMPIIWAIFYISTLVYLFFKIYFLQVEFWELCNERYLMIVTCSIYHDSSGKS